MIIWRVRFARPNPMTRSNVRHRTARLVLLAAVIALGGCGQSAQTRRALEMYESRQYAEALREGEAAARSTRPPERDRASLIAGMSAYELKKYPEAERWLRPLTSNADREIAGRALATLGLIGVAREKYSAAAIDLASAGRRLRGDESARAWFFAGECHAILGRLDQARQSYNAALAVAQSQPLRSRIQARLSSAGYTLQVGAFSSRANADRAASAARARASSAGLAAPMIVAIPDATGRTIYLVHVGRFNSREEAVKARARFGSDAIVAPAR